MEPISNLKERVRVSFDVDPKIHARFDACIRRGNKGDLLRKVFELTTKRIEEGGYLMIGAIMAGDFDPLFERRPKDGKTT